MLFLTKLTVIHYHELGICFKSLVVTLNGSISLASIYESSIHTVMTAKPTCFDNAAENKESLQYTKGLYANVSEESVCMTVVCVYSPVKYLSIRFQCLANF